MADPLDIPREPVTSSNLVSVGYDAPTETLVVEFKGGAIYAFPGVKKVVHTEMMTSDSVGKFFQANIRDMYTCLKLH